MLPQKHFFSTAQKYSKKELVFINPVCTQKEKKTLLMLMENHKNHLITLNKDIIRYAVCDIVLSCDTRNFNMRDCSEFHAQY